MVLTGSLSLQYSLTKRRGDNQTERYRGGLEKQHIFSTLMTIISIRGATATCISSFIRVFRLSRRHFLTPRCRKEHGHSN